jgi:hypothetical protein
MGCGLDDRGIEVLFLEEARDFSLLHSSQTGPWTYPASYAIGAKNSFPGNKTARE